jgi:hypothetical protein
VIEQLAHKIGHGLRDIAVLYARAALMQRLARDFKIFRELGNKMAHLREDIRAIRPAGDQEKATRQAIRQAWDIDERLKLAEHLPQWYLALSNPPLSPAERDGRQPYVTVGEVVAELEPLVQAYTGRVVGGRVSWLWDSAEVPDDLKAMRLAVPRDRKDVLQAALFGCIRAAGEYRDAQGPLDDQGPVQDLAVHIGVRDDDLCFSVRYYGRAVSPEAFIRSYRFYFDTATGLKTLVIPEGQLAELRAIARALNGRMQPARMDREPHAFDLLIPLLDATD